MLTLNTNHKPQTLNPKPQTPDPTVFANACAMLRVSDLCAPEPDSCFTVVCL